MSENNPTVSVEADNSIPVNPDWEGVLFERYLLIVLAGAALIITLGNSISKSITK
jgi:hypothetical protein